MFPRNEAFAADAREILDLCLGDRAPYGLLEFLTSVPDAPRDEGARMTRADCHRHNRQATPLTRLMLSWFLALALATLMW